MAGGISYAQMEDLLNTTLADLPDLQYAVEYTYQNYMASEIFAQDRINFDGGTQIERNIVLNKQGNARFTRPYDITQLNFRDTQRKVTTPWTQAQTSYFWDIDEINKNTSAEGYINLFQTKRLQAMWDLADLLEESIWNTPTNAADDLFLRGIPYYINKLTAGETSEGGYLGRTVEYRDGSTGTIVSGLDGATQERWRNYAFTYTNIDNNFLRRWRRATKLTHWRPPMLVDDPLSPKTSKKRIYTNETTATSLEELLDLRDDNHGSKELMGGVMSREKGSVMLNGTPVIYTAVLDSDTDNPLYCIDLDRLVPFAQSGRYLDETPAIRGGSQQHTVYSIFIDSNINLMCDSRRRAGFIAHQVRS